MSQVPSSPTKTFRGKLTRTSVLILLPLSLIPVIVLGLITMQNTSRFLSQQITAQFDNLAQTQSQRINTLVTDQTGAMENLLLDGLFTQGLTALLDAGLGDPALTSRQTAVLADYYRNQAAQAGPGFDEFLILLPDQTILAATIWEWNGKQLTLDQDWLVQTNAQAQFQLLPLIENQFHTITTYPYQNANDEHVATLVGITFSNYPQILEIASLVNSASRAYYWTQDGHFVGLDPETQELIELQPSPEQRQILESQIETATPGTTAEFISFDDTPVQASLQWLPTISSGLVVEIPQEFIELPLRNQRNLNIALLTVTLIVMGVAIQRGTRQIVRPIVEVANTAQHFAEGDLRVRANVRRNDEIGMLAYSFNYVADELASLYRSLETVVEARTEQIRTAAEVAQIATSAASLDQILQRTVTLIVERFGYYHAAIYLLDRDGKALTLREAASRTGHTALPTGFEIMVGSRSIMGWVSANKKAWVAADVTQDPYYMELETLPQTRSEVGIPLIVGDTLLGVLDVQSAKPNAFAEAEVATLQTLANQIASTLQNMRLLDATRSDLQATSLLYRASHTIAAAGSIHDIFQAVADIVHEFPYASALFRVEGEGLRGMSLANPRGGMITQSSPFLMVPPEELAIKFSDTSMIVADSTAPSETVPEALTYIAERLDSRKFALLPIRLNENLAGLLMVGATDEQSLGPNILEPFNSIIEIANTALIKVDAIEKTTQQVSELQTISTVSQSISNERDLFRLYEVIHQQIDQLMGDVNFLIALYDDENQMIEIPYMDDGSGAIISPDPFPLGQGLTSILIRTRQPLMIVEDSENRMRALGAIVVGGRSAKSWLGVPLLVGGEVIGAMAVQDLENEKRFDDNDLRLMTTLASQVAAAVDNARLLTSTQAAAERDRQIFEITSKIRRASDMRSVLEITTEELSKVFNARRARIEILPETPTQAPELTQREQEEASS